MYFKSYQVIVTKDVIFWSFRGLSFVHLVFLELIDKTEPSKIPLKEGKNTQIFL